VGRATTEAVVAAMILIIWWFVYVAAMLVWLFAVERMPRWKEALGIIVISAVYLLLEKSSRALVRHWRWPSGTLLGVYADDLFNTLFRLEAGRMKEHGYEWGTTGRSSFTQDWRSRNDHESGALAQLVLQS
jgi:hypothetical protein